MDDAAPTWDMFLFQDPGSRWRCARRGTGTVSWIMRLTRRSTAETRTYEGLGAVFPPWIGGNPSGHGFGALRADQTRGMMVVVVVLAPDVRANGGPSSQAPRTSPHPSSRNPASRGAGQCALPTTPTLRQCGGQGSAPELGHRPSHAHGDAQRWLGHCWEIDLLQAQDPDRVAALSACLSPQAVFQLIQDHLQLTSLFPGGAVRVTVYFYDKNMR